MKITEDNDNIYIKDYIIPKEKDLHPAQHRFTTLLFFYFERNCIAKIQPAFQSAKLFSQKIFSHPLILTSRQRKKYLPLQNN